jgi:hypothetical protein
MKMHQQIEEVLQSNPGIDLDVVAEFEQLKRLIGNNYDTRKGSSYTLDLPFEKIQLVQQALLSLQK